MSEKLQKVLARAGIGSRREIEQWIKNGRIQVNGKIAALGERVTENDKILVDGKPTAILSKPQQTRVIMYHKPVGEICTRHDPEGRPTVFDALPKISAGRWIAIGRLDINTTGLMLFTNDGELAHRLMHPAQQIEREYAVRILGAVDNKILHRLTHGVRLEDGLARFEEVVESTGTGANRWFYVVVVQGRNRLVRRLWESQGVTVSRLKRVRFGPIFLEKKLSQGTWAELTGEELQKLMQ